MPIKNARFWIWINDGPVKLTLKPGGFLQHYQAQPTEEGYEAEYTSWYHGGDLIERLYETQSRDCDGRFDTSQEDHCEVDQPHNQDGEILYPKWKQIQSEVYDEFARMAGY